MDGDSDPRQAVSIGTCNESAGSQAFPRNAEQVAKETR
jgi:hypothetical protein